MEHPSADVAITKIRYCSKISDPIIDRSGIQKLVNSVNYFEPLGNSSAPSSAELRERVESACKIQQLRYQDTLSVKCNAQRTSALIRDHCSVEQDSYDLI